MEKSEAIDNAIKRMMTPPSGLSSRIKAAIREGRETSIRPYSWLNIRTVCQLASCAAVLVFAAVIAAAYFQNGDATTTAATDAQYVLDGTFEQPVAVKDDARTLAQPVKLASTDGKALRQYRQASRKFILPERIEHVWAVPSITLALDCLENVARVNGKTLTVLSQDENNCKLQLALTDKETQSLVNMLENRNWALLSPALPQPGEASLLQFSGSTVNYVVTLSSSK